MSTEVHRPLPAAVPPGGWPWEMSRESERFNIASYLPARAAERPHQRAIIMPRGYDALGLRCYSHLSFHGLNAMADRYATGLSALGIGQGDRVLVLVRAGFELIALTFALFKIGAAPVMIDPGMGRGNFLACVADAQPTAMVGIPLAHAIAKVFRKPFGSVRHRVITTATWWAGADAALDALPQASAPFATADTGRDDLAAILFTSGSTGPPKGVEYTHGIFDAQTRAIGEMYGIEPGEIEVPAFPLFSLFSIALGMSCVIPDMDPTKPAEVDPRLIVEAIQDHGATSAFGSPSIWVRVGRYCDQQGIALPSLRRILTAGAPISPQIMERFGDVLQPGVSLHTPYGATESLPVASISSDEVLSETAASTRLGRGICVGHPVPQAQVRIIAIDDAPIATWAEADELDVGEVGEICVSGPMVTRRYDNREQATAAAKIVDPERGPDAFWHRMGDVGYLDERGRIWFCGRKAHRVETEAGRMLTVCCEAIANEHEGVFRSALVGVGSRGAQRPVMIVEPEADAGSSGALVSEVQALLRDSALTAAIEDVLVHPGFPVDRRHNSKIHREELADWAARQLPA